MTVAEVSEVIDAPPEAVWKIVANPENLPIWDHHIYEVEGVPHAGLRRGTEYRTGIRFFGARAHSRATVLEIDPGRYSKVHVDGLVDATVETWLEPLDGGKTHLRHRVAYRFKGGPIGKLAARAVQMLGASVLLRNGIQAQKRQVERSTR